MEYSFVINSTYTDNMLSCVGGNDKCDQKISWSQIESAVNVWSVSPSEFYIIGVGFFHIINCFGHQSTSNVIKSIYGIEVPCNRASVSMQRGFIVVPQYRGPRLPEGVTELPEGSVLEPLINIINGDLDEDYRRTIINFWR